jgi:hypothetical protein
MWLLLPAVIGPVIAASMVPVPTVRLAMVLVVAIGTTTLAFALSGFQYRFLKRGVEIRVLGFRLRSIPRDQIQSYQTEPWSGARGYGIRGIGKTRAYVWGNKVVHIKTSNGSIFLGHRDPARIVRDLDKVMGREQPADIGNGATGIVERMTEIGKSTIDTGKGTTSVVP